MKKKVLFLFILFIFLFISNNYAKYVIEYTSEIAQIKIDRAIPKFELVEITNSNTENKNFANNKSEITITIKVVETNFKEDNFNKENVKILIDDNEITPKKYEIEPKENIGKEKNYILKLSGIEGNGSLKVKILEKTIVDIADNTNEETILEPSITIDNIAPIVEFKQEIKADGKVIVKFEAEEQIKSVNAWNISQDQKTLSKEFANNVTYPFYITDYAKNTSKVEVNVTSATNIQFSYGANAGSEKGEYGYGNNEIIGKRMIEKNPLDKIQTMFFRLTGNIDYDFISMKYHKDQDVDGISALSFKLKDEKDYSIIYQIWVNGQGWQKVAMNGEETTYGYDKPFSCYRVSLIPNTEKQYLIDEWTKDARTNNMK